jgi:hypothetical protein
MANSWLKKWHGNNRHAVVHWAIFLLIAVVAWFFLSNKIQDWIKLNETGVSVTLAKPQQAQLTLSPQTRTVKSGDTFSVDIILDTANRPIDGVDIYSLHYDPTLLQVLDDVSNKTGVQILPGKIMEVNAANIVSSTTGTIKFSQIATGGTNFVGSGVLATMHFKALATGTAYLNFDFVKSSTVDTNAAYKGKDQLGRVVDGIYVIQ